MRATLDRTPLTKLEREAVATFADRITKEFGARLNGIDLFGTSAGSFSSTREISLLVLSNKEDAELEDKAMDMVLDVLLDTGIYLQVKTFSKRRYESFRKAEIPLIKAMETDRTPLWRAA